MKAKISLFLLIALTLITGCKDKNPQTSQPTQKPKSILSYIPKESLFCVVAHDIEGIATSIDDFAIGITPVPVSAATGLKMVAANLTGNVDSAIIDLNGDFALMGIPTGEMITQPDGTEITKPTVVLVIPVKDFSKLEQMNAVSTPDTDGIYTYSMGQQQYVFKKANNYILLTTPLIFPQFTKAFDAITNVNGDVINSKPKYIVDSAENKQIWIYGNLAAVESEYGKLMDTYMEMAIQTVTAQVSQTPQTPQIYEKYLSIMMDMYRDILRDIDSISLAVNIEKDAVKISNAITAVNGSQLAKIMIPDDNKLNLNRMAYLENDSFMRLGLKVNADYYKASSIVFFDFFEDMFKTEENTQTMQKIREISTQWASAVKDDCVISYGFNNDSESKLALSFIAGIDDAEEVESLINKQVEFFNTQDIQGIIESFDLNLELTASNGVNSLDSYPVNKLTYKFDIPMQTEEDAKIFDQMFGEEINGYWVCYDDLLMCTSDNEDISRLKAMAETSKSNAQISDALKENFQMLGDYSTFEFIGTYNYVKLFEFSLATMSSMMPEAQKDSLKFETNSNIVFGGDIKADGMVYELAVPKKHIIEIMSVLPAMQAMPTPQPQVSQK